MKRYFYISVCALISLVWCQGSFAQCSHRYGGYSFHATFGGEGQQRITFNLPALDTIANRIDSVFKYDTARFGYCFLSFDENGNPLGEGSFHFRLDGKWKYNTVDDFDRMLKWSVWSQLHVVEMAYRETPDIIQLFPCRHWRTHRCCSIEHSLFEGLTSNPTVESVYSRVMYRRDD